MKNIIIAHGGAPTAVINASLAGVLLKLKELKFDGKIYAARYGSLGLLNEDFIDLTNITDENIKLLIKTPSSAIGSSRVPLYDAEYEKIIDNLIKNNIGYVLFTGGNGSMDSCGNIYKHVKNRNCSIYCCGIPKTIDNDIAITDHAPGYISCAKYMMQTTADANLDIKSLPIHVTVIESMGRNTGWLTAASALARKNEGDSPHLLLFPEVAFDEDEFLKRVKQLYDKYHGVIVVASEGLKDKDGKPIVQPVFKTDRATYYGDVSSYLQQLIISKLSIKARSEKPGLIARCCSSIVSDIDIDEAILMGKVAIDAVLNKKTAVMAGIKRLSSNPYKIEPILIPIEKVMLEERVFPVEFMSKDKYDVSEEFINWARPIIGYPTKTISFL